RRESGTGSGSRPAPEPAGERATLPPPMPPPRQADPPPPPHIPYPPPPPLAPAAPRGRQGGVGALRSLGQGRSTLFVCEGSDGLYLLDQHAAAERVTFHRLKRAFDAREVASQKMLFPVVVEVSPSEVALVEEQHEIIGRTGLEVRAAGPSRVAVHAVP